MNGCSEEDFKKELVSLLPRLRRFALKLSGDEDNGDDLVQAACERALTKIHQWKPGSHMDRWMFSIIRSLWSNELRSQTIRLGAGVVDAEQCLVLDGTKRLESNVELESVVRAVFDLSYAHRVVLLLVYIEGYSYTEAAEALDVPVGTVMSRLARARLSLADDHPEFAAGLNARRRDRNRPVRQNRRLPLHTAQNSPGQPLLNVILEPQDVNERSDSQ
ncbi:MAG: RNA polymerase sigma factor [Gammaproteobacteria bacterium]